MTAIEIILLVAGVICVIVSFVMPSGSKEKEESGTASFENNYLSKQEIIHQIDDAVSEHIGDIIEKTEASLDKISNTKILEMQDYADTILGEMNKNHNETMFLYDMLNDKSREIKGIVRNINNIKYEENAAENDKTNVSSSAVNNSGKGKNGRNGNNGGNGNSRNNHNGTNNAKNGKNNKYSNGRSENDSEELLERLFMQAAQEESEEADERTSVNDEILRQYKAGKSVLEIAKSLNLGVGQTSLVIDLYEGKK